MKKPEYLIILAGILAFLPFISRPLFIDDHPVYKQALDLKNHPSKPYVKKDNRPGWEAGQNLSEANPPLYFYVIGLFTWIFGSAIWKAHLFVIPFHLITLLAFYRLARDNLKHPVFATMIFLVSPQFWITGTSMLVGVFLPPLILGSIVLWIEGWKSNRIIILIVAAILLGLAPLTKYTGLLSWAAVVFWSLSQKDLKNKWKNLMVFIIPILFFSGWLLWSKILYQEAHLNTLAQQRMTLPTMQHILFLFAFTSATTLIVAIPSLIFLNPSKNKYFKTTVLIFSLGLLGGLALGFKPKEGLQLGFWIATFTVWLFLIGQYISKNIKKNGWLLGWILCGMIGLSVSWNLYSARYFVIIGPALVLLTLSLLEAKIPGLMKRVTFRRGLFALIAIPSLVLTLADFQQAHTTKKAAQDLNNWKVENFPNANFHYPSATLESIGFHLGDEWNPLAPGQKLPEGEFLVLPFATLPKQFYPRYENATIVANFVYNSINPLRTHSRFAHAGFYGTIWEPLPFSATKKPMGIYTLIQEQEVTN